MYYCVILNVYYCSNESVAICMQSSQIHYLYDRTHKCLMWIKKDLPQCYCQEHLQLQIIVSRPIEPYMCTVLYMCYCTSYVVLKQKMCIVLSAIYAVGEALCLTLWAIALLVVRACCSPLCFHCLFYCKHKIKLAHIHEDSVNLTRYYIGVYKIR